MDDNSKKRKKKLIIQAFLFAIIIIILILLLIKCAYNYTKENNNQDRDPAARMGQIDGKTEAEIQEELDRVVLEGRLIISINTEIEMDNGKAFAPLKIENVPNNHFLIKVAITLDNTGETVYTSGFIEPNYHIQTARLSKVLSKGNYPATATFFAYDMETEQYIGQQKVKVNIIVNN